MSLRIVVADKDPASREAVTRFLSEEDSEFIGVSSSDELKQAIKSHSPDLIILNTVLSDAPGWRIVPRIKESKQYSHVPVLLMTGDPGSPSQGEVETSGADGYVSKPIDGSALKSAVGSLLGRSDLGDGAVDDDEIVIDFSDEDSGDMTQELLAISSAATRGEDVSTGVGDTVEIDAGTLVAEVDDILEVEEDESYGDTVKLNLDDMELDDEEEEDPQLEPTIELVTEIDPDGLADEITLAPGRDSVELEEERDIPDFSSVTMDVSDSAPSGKDSVTVDLDVDELGLELEAEEGELVLDVDGWAETDDDGRDMEKILEVQDPSRILTSEELMLDDDSLVQDSITQPISEPVDIIDLEEDDEIADIEMEEFEGIDAGPLGDEEIELDETTVPVRNLDMEQLANEDLQEIELGDTMELGSVGDEALVLESTEELSVEGIGEEEMTTEEFFGEELATEEFPTESFPEEDTGAFSVEQEIALEEMEVQDELPAEVELPEDELTLDTESAEEILASRVEKDEPVLEVTEDILLDEISFEETLEEPDEAAVVGSPFPGRASDVPASIPSRAAYEQAIPSKEQIVGMLSDLVDRRIGAALPGKGEFTDSLQTALKGYAGDREEVAGLMIKTLEASLPTKEEMLDAIAKGMSDVRPDSELVVARVDEVVTASLPPQEEILRRVDETIREIMPSAEVIVESLDTALQLVPSQEDVLETVSRSLEGMPSSDVVLSSIEGQVSSLMPEREEVHSTFLSALERKIDTILAESDLKNAIPAILPETEDLIRSFQEALPGKDRLQETLVHSIAQALDNSLPERVWLESVSRGLFDERTKGLLPDRREVVAMLREEIQVKLLDTVEKIVRGQINRLTTDLDV